MIGRAVPSSLLRLLAFAAALLLVGPAEHAAGPNGDRKAPTTPSNRTEPAPSSAARAFIAAHHDRNTWP